MANKVTIDVEARFTDNVTSEAKSATKSFENLERAAEGTVKAVNAVGKTRPKVNVDSSNAEKKLNSLDKMLNRLGKVQDVLVKIRDSNVLSTLNKMSTGLKSLTSKAWSVAVKVPNAIFGTLTKLKNSLFNIKNLIAGIAAAWATQKLVISPIGVADAYSSAKISFSTLLGEAGGQKMMDDLDAFAKATPFKTSGVIENAQKMLAMGWSPEDIIGDMEIIGNAAAATGKMDQGLESIVRAMSQIKTKGKLSTEELNQLAEAGIAAKAMLAENLGYGTGDEGIAAMTKDLENGAIASNVAIEALLQGMRKYDGMMDSMANETAAGLKSQIEDVFEINILRKWGQGLQDGAKRGLGKVVDLLDDAEDAMSSLGDTVYEVGKKLSNWAADKLENTIKRITKITGSSEFKNASLGGKISMLWDGVVADPLQEWWDNGGEEKTATAANKIGSAMGTLLSKGLQAVFGATDILNEDVGTEAGGNVAGAFVQGFLDNFDGQAVTDAFVNAIGNVWDAIPWWAKGILGIWGAGKAAGGIATAAGAITKGIGAVGSATAMTGALGFGAKTAIGLGAGNLAGGASMSAGALAATGLGATAGGAAGAVSAVKGGVDLYKGYTTDDAVEAGARKRSGWTALGGVGGGAAAGAAIGSAFFGIGAVPGALIGAGVGGIGGLLGGNAWANHYRDVNTTVGVNITGEKNIMNTIDVLAEDFGIPEEHADTVALLLTGDKELLNKIDVSKLAEEFGIPESQAKTIIEELTAAKSIENRLEVLSSDFGIPDSISKTISVNLTAIAGTVKNFVGDIFGGGSDGGGNGSSGGGGFARGGIVGGSTRFIRVNEESPEMIIPLSSQRRDRALKLWSKTGELLDVPGFARGGNTDGSQDEGIRYRSYGNSDSAGGRTVQVNMGGIKLEINVSGSDNGSIVEAIKAQAGDLADYIVGVIADSLETEFENTPVRGGAV